MNPLAVPARNTLRIVQTLAITTHVRLRRAQGPTSANAWTGPVEREALNEFGPKLRGYFVNRGCNRNLAEDLAQETLLKVWEKRDAFDPERGSLSTWVFAIARNTFIDHIRKSSRPSADPTDPAWVPASPVGADTALTQNEQAARLREALGALPDEQRQALRATLIEGRSMAQYATESETAPGTIKTRVRLGLQKLRKALRDER